MRSCLFLHLVAPSTPIISLLSVVGISRSRLKVCSAATSVSLGGAQPHMYCRMAYHDWHSLFALSGCMPVLCACWLCGIIFWQHKSHCYHNTSVCNLLPGKPCLLLVCGDGGIYFAYVLGCFCRGIRYLSHMPITGDNSSEGDSAILFTVRALQFTLLRGDDQVWFPGCHPEACCAAC